MFHRDMTYTREIMVNDLQNRGVFSGAVLDLMMDIPRHHFVSQALSFRAYDETSLPIGYGQTISKPSIIGKMVQALGLTGNERVLEIGTGSGYQTAIMAKRANFVVTLERIEGLYQKAKNLLYKMDYTNIQFIHSDNFEDAEGTFDAIIVAAGTEKLPVKLFNKLNINGRLIIPVGENNQHHITKYIKKNDDEFLKEEIGIATFVPYIT